MNQETRFIILQINIITFLGKTLISLLESKLITVDSNTRTNNSFGYLKCSNPNKKPSNAEAKFESTKIKTRLFSNTVNQKDK